jgi:hypothetical protein
MTWGIEMRVSLCDSMENFGLHLEWLSTRVKAVTPISQACWCRPHRKTMVIGVECPPPLPGSHCLMKHVDPSSTFTSPNTQKSLGDKCGLYRSCSRTSHPGPFLQREWYYSMKMHSCMQQACHWNKKRSLCGRFWSTVPIVHKITLTHFPLASPCI